MAVMGAAFYLSCVRKPAQRGRMRDLALGAEVPSSFLGPSGSLFHSLGSAAALPLALPVVSGQCCVHELGFKPQLHH